jgi:hypothetical protein
MNAIIKEINGLGEQRWRLCNEFGRAPFFDGRLLQEIEKIDKRLGELAGAPNVGQDKRSFEEGWCLIDNEDGTFTIEADHESRTYCSQNGVAHDDLALAYVERMAKDGSAYHLAALAKNSVRKSDDHIACSKCGQVEHVNLIDSKSHDGTEGGDFTILQCIACCGPGWAPRDVGDIKLSAVPHFKPLYDEWLRKNSRGED